MSEIQKDWNWVKLGDLCDKISLNKIKIKQKDYLREGSYPVVDQGQDLIGGYYNDKNLVIPNEPPFIIFGDHTKIKKYITFKFIAGADGVKVLKAKDVIDSKFLYYSLFTIKIEDKGYARHFQLLEKELFPLPPKPIQEAIVSKIEELFSEIENGIKSLLSAQQQLKTYRQSVLKWAFEGRLTEEWREKTGVRFPAAPLWGNIAAEPEEEYKIKKNQGNQNNHTNHSSDKGKLPEGWKWVSIEEVASVGTGATPLKSKFEYYGGNILWVTSGALNDEYVREATDFVTEKAVRETNLSVYPKHTLLVAMYGEGKTRGKCSELLIEASTNQAIAAIHFNEKEISIKPYLKYFLLKNYTDVRKKSSGGVQPNLNLGIIKKLQFPLAPIEEQSLIVQAIESRLSVADKMEESITQSLQQAEVLKQSILKKAFEGKLL